MYQCLTQKDTLLYIIKSGVYRWPALKIKQHQNLASHLNRHYLLLKNGATPNFIEFKDENESVVASISISGDLDVSGLTAATPNFTGPLGSTGVATFQNTLVLQQSLEKVTSSITANGTTNIDVLSSALFNCSSTGDFTFNFRGDSSTELDSLMSIDQSLTTVLFVANTVARSLSGINIDGSSQTIKWFGGSAPSGNASSTDVYTITILKTPSATPDYEVYASQSKFA